MVCCKICGENTKHYGKGKCQKCYMKEYIRLPRVKKRRAWQERERRAKGLHLESERKRAKTKKRKDWARKYRREYYKKNREHLLAYQREYRKDTTRQTIYKQRRRNMLKGLPSTLTPKEWQELLEEHNHKCAYCGTNGKPLEAEHKIPASRGGGYTKENIVPSCGPCNRQKKQMTPEEYNEYLQDVS